MSKKEKQCSSRLGAVGGQALIEGIMMRGPKGAALSVRVPDGSIDTEKKDFRPLKEKYKILGIPFLRGIVGFVESMVIGYKCLMESADKSGMTALEEEEEPGRFEKFMTRVFGEKLMTFLMTVASILGVGLAIFLFMWLPSVLFDLVNRVAGGGIDNFRAIIEGILRIAIFITYLALVSKMKDIRRTFEYHGAEHKTIFCYESDVELTVENVRKFKRFHPRCGTSFLFVIMLISILISSLLSIFTSLSEVRAVWIITKILILPVVMGIGFEFIKYAGKHENLFTKIVSAPGLWMQRLTTKEPDDSQIEVAIAALNAVLTEEAPAPAPAQEKQAEPEGVLKHVDA